MLDAVLRQASGDGLWLDDNGRDRCDAQGRGGLTGRQADKQADAGRQVTGNGWVVGCGMVSQGVAEGVEGLSG